MPKQMEMNLKAEASKKGLTGKRADAYVYGTMQKTTDWKPGKKDFHGQIQSALGKGKGEK